jgi:hypothetical protein
MDEETWWPDSLHKLEISCEEEEEVYMLMLSGVLFLLCMKQPVICTLSFMFPFPQRVVNNGFDCIRQIYISLCCGCSCCRKQTTFVCLEKL